MKAVYVFGSLFAFTVGIGAALGINAYLSGQSKSASTQESAVAQTTPTVQPVQSAQPVVASQPAPVQNFESMSLCDQMDAIAKSGKSVAQFIADSGRYSEFEANVKANCSWNAEQLNQAYAILNPPVITIRPQIIEEPVVVQPQPVKEPVVAPPVGIFPWNNCNGIQEPGESYSVACHKAQAHNDLDPKGPQDPLDNRVTDDFGEKGEVNGYYMPTENVNQTDETQSSDAESSSAE